jgi:predicted transcriptional regulator
VRHGKVGPIKTEQLLFYVKHPVREFRGKADFVERKTGNPDKLWNELGIETVFESYRDYKEFVKGREDVTFIRLRNLEELTYPVSAKTFLEKTSGGSMLPRGGRYIGKELAGIFV